MTSHEHHTWQILARIEAGDAPSQRSLSRELGIALGLTNLLLRRTVREGWVRLERAKPNRLAYLITPAGLAAKARMSRNYFKRALQLYSEARARIRETFDAVLGACQGGSDGLRRTVGKQVVFYGAGQVAEIGYVCLQNTGLSLVGVVDDARTSPFFGIPVYRSGRLAGLTLAGEPFDHLIVMSFDEEQETRARLEALGVPAQRVWWL